MIETYEVRVCVCALILKFFSHLMTISFKIVVNEISHYYILFSINVSCFCSASLLFSFCSSFILFDKSTNYSKLGATVFLFHSYSFWLIILESIPNSSSDFTCSKINSTNLDNSTFSKAFQFPYIFSSIYFISLYIYFFYSSFVINKLSFISSIFLLNQFILLMRKM